MAAVRTPLSTGSFANATAGRGVRSQWGYSIPIDGQDHSSGKTSTESGRTRSYRPSTDRQLSAEEGSNRPSQLSGRPRTSQSTTGTVEGRLLPPPGILGRKDSDVSRNGSDPDSLLDLYGSNSAQRSRDNSMDYAEQRPSRDQLILDEQDPETSRWIHRDKLLRIESEELQRAGFHIGHDSRPSSRHIGRRERSRDMQTRASKESGGRGNESQEERLPRMPSPITTMEEDRDDGLPTHFDLRTAEEIAADPEENGEDNMPYEHSRWATSNSSHSRIPIHKSSPLPIPQDYIERHTPLQRRASGEDQSIAYKNASRSRSLSMSSQMILDDGEPARSNSPTFGDTRNLRATPPTSPIKAKTPGHQSRKASMSRNGPKSATRPTTRSGEVKRPEGDPPWLASMYKPDPRLPPDQQLLPTVAKRLQQEQWEREGKFGDVFDRELNPLSVHTAENELGHYQPTEPERDYHEEPSQQSKSPGLEIPGTVNGDAEWPLRRSRSPGGSSIGRPGTSGNEHGGYKTMPTVRDAAPSPNRGRNSDLLQTTRVQDPEFDATAEKASKGKSGACACCLVM